MKQNTYGFTIVELLIVIVVIAILAALSYVGYVNLSAKARDAQRLSDVQQIIRAVNTYRAEHGSYPSSHPHNTSATCASHNNGYSYSTATDGRWMVGLRLSGLVTSIPVAPGNDCTSYYRYLKPTPTSYGCPARTEEYALLQVFGVEGAPVPEGAVTSIWKPCAPSAVGWGPSGPTNWTFILE